jgi:tRNA nucleotidyltransferase (CCA-adding enzyme)
MILLSPLNQLLGSQSNDMDVALSDIMGLAFAEHLTEFAHSKGIELGTISKIEQNPDQSKHLETATFKVFGLDIDLVNLRSEEYAESSRIPTGVVSFPYKLLFHHLISSGEVFRHSLRRRT